MLSTGLNELKAEEVLTGAREGGHGDDRWAATIVADSTIATATEYNMVLLASRRRAVPIIVAGDSWRGVVAGGVVKERNGFGRG